MKDLRERATAALQRQRLDEAMRPAREMLDAARWIEACMREVLGLHDDDLVEFSDLARRTPINRNTGRECWSFRSGDVDFACERNPEGDALLYAIGERQRMRITDLATLGRFLELES